MRAAVLCSLFLLAGVGLGWALRRSGAPPSPSEAATSPAVPAPRPIVVNAGGGGVGEDTLRDVVRRVVRDELERAHAGNREAASSATPAPPPTEESEVARDKGLALVSNARSGGGRWTDANVADLRALLPTMTPEQRDEIFHTLLPALNRGELTRDSAGMPF